MASAYNDTRLQPVRAGMDAPGVGSNVTQPWFGKKASTQECALLARTTYCDVRSLNSPVRNPFTTRDGIPRVLSITAIEEAKYSQCPCLRSKRKFARGSRGALRESCRV